MALLYQKRSVFVDQWQIVLTERDQLSSILNGIKRRPRESEVDLRTVKTKNEAIVHSMDDQRAFVCAH